MNKKRFRLCVASVCIGFFFATPAMCAKALLPGFEQSRYFKEQTCTVSNAMGYRLHINAPSPKEMARAKRITLVFYTLPNGNTIEQTVGKTMKPGDDWHFDIQHVGAQTRYLRKRSKDPIVVAYLEAGVKSWPAWRKKSGDAVITNILDSIRQRFAKYKTDVVLAGHSGGGSFIFGYLNAVEKIPNYVTRLAFLDANYGYDPELHKNKLVEWLKSSKNHSLIVFAYQDYVALLNGKPFVSEAGGTWGKSRQMRETLGTEFPFTSTKVENLEIASALNGQIRLYLRENPEKKIWHTVQVELNGFIHALSIGTKQENKGYTYLGPRVYSKLIQPE